VLTPCELHGTLGTLPHSTRAPEPLGKGGEQLHDWVVATRSWRQTHAKQGGETGPNDEIADEHFQNIGASIMGRHMFGGGTGPWPTNPPWKGWWGDNPPFHHPVFVLTHHPRKPLEMQGGTTFYFVTDGIHRRSSRRRRPPAERTSHSAVARTLPSNS
jgi:dihydrofolate reductase